MARQTQIQRYQFHAAALRQAAEDAQAAATSWAVDGSPEDLAAAAAAAEAAACAMRRAARRLAEGSA